jgi:hypothetical protein
MFLCFCNLFSLCDNNYKENKCNRNFVTPIGHLRGYGGQWVGRWKKFQISTCSEGKMKLFTNYGENIMRNSKDSFGDLQRSSCRSNLKFDTCECQTRSSSIGWLSLGEIWLQCSPHGSFTHLALATYKVNGFEKNERGDPWVIQNLHDNCHKKNRFLNFEELS